MLIRSPQLSGLIGQPRFAVLALFILCLMGSAHARQTFPLGGGTTRLTVEAAGVQLLEGKPVYWMKSQPQQPITLATESGTLSAQHALARTEIDCAAQSARVPTTEYRDAAGQALRVVTNPQAPARPWPKSGDLAGWHAFLCHAAKLSSGGTLLSQLAAGGNWAVWQNTPDGARGLRRDAQGAALTADVVTIRETFNPPRAAGGTSVAVRTSTNLLDCKAQTLTTLAQASFAAAGDGAASRARFRAPGSAEEDFRLFAPEDARALCTHLADSQAERDRAAVKRHVMPGADKPAGRSHAAEVRFLAGRATTEREGRAVPLVVGMQLRSGDLIQTGPDGEVHLAFIDGALMSIRKNTQLRIGTYAYDPPGQLAAVFELVRGTVRSVTGLVARQSPADYRIQTRLATIGVRGTDHEPYVLLEGEDPETPPGVYNKVNKGESTLQPLALPDASAKQAIAPGRVGFVRDFAAEDAAARARGEEVKPRSPLLLMPSLIAVIPRIFVPAPNEKGFEALIETTESSRSR
ncbi:MAG: FecR family protein [Burkholderiales bacterium]|nr:FecR family protein [Burkholderiales bacterium]